MPRPTSSRRLARYGVYGDKQPEPSIREFRVALEKNPKHVDAHNNLAEVLRRNGRYDEALVECRAALAVVELPEGHRTMANILAAKNEYPTGRWSNFRPR